jgi:hypothetical protein
MVNILFLQLGNILGEWGELSLKKAVKELCDEMNWMLVASIHIAWCFAF